MVLVLLSRLRRGRFRDRLGERECAENARTCAERGRRHVVVGRLEVEVPVHEPRDARGGRAAGGPAAASPPPITIRSGESTEIAQTSPSARYSAWSCQTASSSSSDAGRPQRASTAAARREAFPAVAVVGADARKRVGVAVVRDAHVAELGVDEAVHERSADHRAAADPRPDRDVTEGVESPGGAPALLAERGRVDVGVEGDRYRKPAADLLADVGVRPARLRRRRDVSPGRGRRLAVDGAERADADRRRPVPPVRRRRPPGRASPAGVVVGTVSVARRSSGPVPTAHSHFEPPASIPPNAVMRRPRGVSRRTTCA